MNRGDPMQASVSGFRDGLLLVFEGGRLLRRERSLWMLASLPVLFATILVGITASLFATRMDSIHQAWTAVLPVLEATTWWSWIWVGPGMGLVWLLGWIGVVLAFAFSLLVALLVANLLSAPFLDQLSQRVESIVTGETPTGGTDPGGVWVEALRSFSAELQRLAFFAVIWIVLGLTGFVVPGAHLVTGPLLIATTVALLPLDYAGFALDRRQVSFRSRRRWLGANWPTMIGFGGVAFVACLIPGLNLLIMPVLVTAGTLLVLRATPPSSE
jgi:CysZ protein